MEVSQNSEDLVDNFITDWGVDVWCYEVVLDCLKQFHGEEEEDPRGKLGIAGLGINPPGAKQPWPK